MTTGQPQDPKAAGQASPTAREPGWRSKRPLEPPPGDVAEQLLVAIAEHRLLTVEQLRVLCGWRDDDGYASRQYVSRQLHALQDLGYVGWVRRRGGQGGVWFVTQLGADAAALADGPADRRIVVLRESQVRARTQAHTLAVNEVGVAFTRWARAGGDACAWSNEVSHKVMEGAGPSKGQLNADAYLRYESQLDQDQWAFRGFFVELDRGHMTAGQLGEKLRRYAQFTTFTLRGTARPAWQAFYGRFPTVLYVFASAKQRRRGESAETFAGRTRPQLLRRVASLAAYCDADPLVRTALNDAAPTGAVLRVRLCLLEDLERLGPHERIALDPASGAWSPLVDRSAPAADEAADDDAEPAA
jgi:Replication-relaxation